ncbi:hypothetical protein DAT35_12885 [Vitiosangium sp. GDMCC 1.1324]|nr:hypothetical protein DAT35_12885 [Vitiosangium sp. GDMCC 1.1324]
MSRYLAWFICLVLSLGLQPGQLTRSLNSALSARAPAGQQGQSQSNTEEHHDHAVQVSLKGISQRIHPKGPPKPTRGWLVLRAALNAHPTAPEPLVSEDVRHVLLPRRTPPPEPDQQHV